MKFLSSLFLLAAPFLVTAEEENNRDLQIADWHVTIQSMADQGFTFDTGPGAGTNPNIKIHVYDKCRLESATRVEVGEFYPLSNVPGIDCDSAGITNNPGLGNSINWAFIEGINANTDLYVDNGDNTATVNMCILVGLYEDTTLIDYAEAKMTYNIDLVTNFASLTGYTVTQAEAFTDADDTAISFDGTLMAYFCDDTTKAELTNDGSKTNQGSILHVCFKVPDGQFEVKDVMEFTVKNAAAATPSQQIITGSSVASAIYAEKDCTDVDATDTNICTVSFLLTADFYDFAALTLTGTGSVLLEFGDASGSRRMLRSKLEIADSSRRLADDVQEEFQVTAHSFEVDNPNADSSASSAMTTFAAIGAVAGAALVL